MVCANYSVCSWSWPLEKNSTGEDRGRRLSLKDRVDVIYVGRGPRSAQNECSFDTFEEYFMCEDLHLWYPQRKIVRVREVVWDTLIRDLNVTKSSAVVAVGTWLVFRNALLTNKSSFSTKLVTKMTGKFNNLVYKNVTA